MGEYFDLIMEPTKNSFPYYFNTCWSRQLDQMAKPYSDALQLRIGNQLRPKLTCWGAALNTNHPDELDLNAIAEIASYIEMLHKASIIIDDMIDGDDARHGEKTFHVEFGRDKATIFALCLLGKGTEGINKVFQPMESHFSSVALYSNTIHNMAMGALEELNLNTASRYDISKIRRIIKLETISLIKDSFLLGYWSNFNGTSDVESVIMEIGDNCGFIFQILNDLEPFSSLEKNIAYKGGMNLDINRKRKSIVVAYIFNAASVKEKQLLLNEAGAELQDHILRLYEKYSVFDRICAEARAIEQDTLRLVNKLREISMYTGSIDDFEAFILQMIKICFSKLGQ